MYTVSVKCTLDEFGCRFFFRAIVSVLQTLPNVKAGNLTRFMFLFHLFFFAVCIALNFSDVIAKKAVDIFALKKVNIEKEGLWIE